MLFAKPSDQKTEYAGMILDGGEAANIIPAHTSAEFSIRSLTTKRRDVLIEKVIACAQAAAQAIGCQLKYKVKPGYKDIIPNKVLAELFKSNLESLGRVVVDPDPNERMGSTDMGDISHIVPCHSSISSDRSRKCGWSHPGIQRVLHLRSWKICDAGCCQGFGNDGSRPVYKS